MSDFCMIYVTCSSVEEARKIGNEIITQKLAACANIQPKIVSLYTWNNELQDDEESVLILKTQLKHFETIKQQIQKLHSYECPCILALPIVAGNKPYLDWLKQQSSS